MFVLRQPSRRLVIVLAAILSIACAETLAYHLFRPSRTAGPVPLGEMTAEQARDYVHQNENVVVIDVRTRKEFSASHFPDALNVPLHSLPQLVDKIPRNHPVLVYCLQGYRAIQAYKVLKRLRPDLHDVRFVAGWLLSLPSY